MKKLLIGIPLIAGVAGASYAGTSYYGKIQTENAYQRMLVQLNELKPFVFEQESYESGLMESSAITLVKESSAANAPVLFRLQHEINHAPIQLGDEPKFGKATIRTTWLDSAGNNDARELARTLFYGAEPFELITTVSTQSDITNELTIERFNYTENMKSFDVAASTLTFITEGDHTKGSGTLGTITLSDDNQDFVTVSPSDIKVDVNHSSPDAYDYDFSWLANTLTVNAPDLPDTVAVNGVGINANSDVANGKIDQAGSFSFKGLNLGDMMPADQLPINSGAISFELKDMQVGAYKAFEEMINQLSLQDQMAPDSKEAQMIFAEAFKKLLTPGINLKYGLQASNAGGDADASYKLTFVGDNSATGFDHMVTVADALNAVEIDANAKIDKAALQMTPAAMFIDESMLAMGMVDEGDHYRATAKMVGSSLKINGMTLPIYEMMGDVLDMTFEEVLEQQGY